MKEKDILSSIRQIRGSEKTLPEQAADRIRGIIVDRELNIGDKLPSEFDLAQQLAVGRGTVREAIKILIARNVLEIRRGIGTYVADNTGLIDDPFGFAYLGEDDQLVKELFPIRLQLEPWIAERAAQNATSVQIKQLRVYQQNVEKLIRSHQNHLFEDQKFHTHIADCTGNRVLPKLVPVIVYSVHNFGRLTHRARGLETIATHEAIVDAIAAHDAATARQAMTDHLMMNWEYIQELLEKR